MSAVLGAPLALFMVCEVTLRLIGFGYPTGFLLKRELNGQEVFIQNNQFGWRFFGRRQSRHPAVLKISCAKGPDTIRVFVFGESAAFGDPQPDFGLSRVLAVMLNARHPAVHFEVINAAMTGINSHAIVRMARDCVRADGDIWVVYMGNNEVVGPFGAGTVFGNQAPPPWLIHANLALKSTRSGQAMAALIQQLNPLAPEKSEWGGMMMFVGNQVEMDDLRLRHVYSSFRNNLEEIIRIGEANDIRTVVSTVAVNLRDCPPFASSSELIPESHEAKEFHDLISEGESLFREGRFREAVTPWLAAEQLDQGVAELQYRLGQAFARLNELPEARRRLRLARDLDSLRFRCDSRLNGIIREVVEHHADVRLADAERAFDNASDLGLAGGKHFLEHVHLTFEGTYLLARTVATEIETILPERVGTTNTRSSWLSVEECAARLAWGGDEEHAILAEIAARMGDPPFTMQLSHERQMANLHERMLGLLPQTQKPALQFAEARCVRAAEEARDDAALYARLAKLRQKIGNLSGATEAAQRVVKLMPHSSDAWDRFGVIEAQLQNYTNAVECFQESLAIDPENVFVRAHLAQALVRMQQQEAAVRELEQALRIQPRFGTAHLALGRIHEEQGRQAEADVAFREALLHRVNRPMDLAALARVCQSRGWWEAAFTNYRAVLQMDPSDAAICLSAGECLKALGRYAEARDYYALAVRIAPEHGQARFLLGRELGREGDAARAAEEFAEAVRLLPDVLEARINLGVALMQSGRHDEALEEFQEVLKRDPTNAVALLNIGRMRE